MGASVSLVAVDASLEIIQAAAARVGTWIHSNNCQSNNCQSSKHVDHNLGMEPDQYVQDVPAELWRQ